MYSGNTPSSSYDNVILRLPLGSNDKEESGSFHPKIGVNFLEYGGVAGNTAEALEGSQIENGFIVEGYHREVKSNISVFDKWEEVVETHHLPTPDTVGASMTSEKIRVENSTIPSDNLLMVDKRREMSTLDSQPPDYEDLGIYFSPTNEINEDILYTLGSFRLDDYIGDPLPSAQTSSIYNDLKDIRNYYNKKVEDQYNYSEYIKLIQQYDHTLFKIIENFTPARANLKTGLLVEPNFLERSKIQREVPIRSDGQTMITGSHQTFEITVSANYADNQMYAFASSSQLTKVGFGCDKFPNSPGCTSASIGEWEPGSYVVSYNNLTNTTSSKTSERLEQGLNTTIEIYDDYMDPTKRKNNRWGYPHGFNSQPSQGPIRPFVQRLSNLVNAIGSATISPNKGIGFSAISSGFKVEGYIPTTGVLGSFAVGEFSSTPILGGNFKGVGFSGVQCGFTVQGYTTKGIYGIGAATVENTFIVEVYSNQPKLNPNYKTHISNTLLGNITTGRKSKKYFQYQTYAIR